jgi:putative ABC transport system ATP-binding protein
MTAALQTKTVRKTYQLAGSLVVAVSDVSVQVDKGEFVALVGPSGSGKTTLLAMLAGLLRPSEGQVLIEDQDLAQMSEGERAQFRREKIGFTFQANNLVPYLTVTVR